MNGEMIEFKNGAEHYGGYLSRPAKPGPGIIVIQEWWGLVDHIKHVADRFAAEGFVALAPDLYRGDSTKEPDDAASKMQALNIAETERILGKAIESLLAQPDVSPNDRVGSVGFCMGGQLSLFAASTNRQVAACVDFYGIHPMVHPELEDIGGSVLGIFAGNDTFTTPAAVKKLDADLTAAGVRHEFTTYPDCQHAFFNDDRPEVYDPAAAADAWTKTLDFLREHLAVE